MFETTLHPPRSTFPDDAALDTAAETLTGLTLVDAADLAWASLAALAEGDRSDTDSTPHHAAFGDSRLNAIETGHVQEWENTLALTLSPGSVRNVYEVLAQILSSAVNRRLIARSPIVRRG